MALRSIHDIPDEIKNIIELFYLRGEIVARDEMVKLRATRADLNNLIDEVSQLFPTAPESVFMFYDALIAADGLASNLDSDLAFAVSDLMGDASDAPESDFRFSVSGSSKLIVAEPNRRTRRTEEASDYAPLLFDFPETIDDDESLDAAVATEVPSFREKLNESLQASTQVPSIFADGSDGRKPDGQSYGLRGRELSSNPEKSTEINLDIDIDFDFFASGAEEVIEGGLEVGGADIVGESGEHESVIKLKNSDDLIEKASNEYMTPVPNNMQAAQIDKLQEKSRSVSSSMPSIMRASQKPSPSEEYSQPRRISEFFDSELASDSHIRVGRTSSSSLAAQSRPTLPHTEAVALSSRQTDECRAQYDIACRTPRARRARIGGAKQDPTRTTIAATFVQDERIIAEEGDQFESWIYLVDDRWQHDDCRYPRYIGVVGERNGDFIARARGNGDYFAWLGLGPVMGDVDQNNRRKCRFDY